MNRIKFALIGLIHLMIITITINAQTPCNFQIDIGPDLSLEIGESVQFEALINVPLDQINNLFWTPSTGLSCDDCLNPVATLIEEVCYTLSVTDTSMCTVLDTICLTTALTNTTNTEQNYSFKLYPIPTNKLLIVESRQCKSCDVQVFNALGELIKIQVLHDDEYMQLDVSKLSPGSYFLKLNSGRQNGIQKFIIAK